MKKKLININMDIDDIPKVNRRAHQLCFNRSKYIRKLIKDDLKKGDKR